MRVFGQLFIAVAVSLAVGFTGSMVYADGDNTTSALGFQDTDADNSATVSANSTVSAEDVVSTEDIEIIGTGNSQLKATAYVDLGDQEQGGLSSGGILLGRALGTVEGDTGTPTGAVSENERLGYLVGRGYDGNNWQNGAALTIKVDGPVASGSVPARFTIETGSTFSDRQDRLVVKSDGKIGIGTTTPSYDLDVVGDINFTGNLYQDGNLWGGIVFNESLWKENNSDIYYNSGNVGIGDSSPDYDLDVVGDINFTGNLYQEGSLFSNGDGGTTSLWSENNGEIYYNSGNVGIGTTSPDYKLEVNGDAAGTSWTNLSSREYKENIKKVDSAKHDEMLSKLMKVNLSTYNYKKEYGDDHSTKLGFIAEEMPQEVLSKDGKGVDVYELLTYTIGAMKAQQKQIDELKAKLSKINI